MRAGGTGDPRAGAHGTGQAGEDVAARHLAACGLLIVDRNWRSRLGEIDLVALDGAYVVFVEVKTRRGTGFGPAAAAVDGRKQARLRRLALAYLAERGWLDRPCRFDVVAVTPAPGGGWEVEWLQDAFQA